MSPTGCLRRRARPSSASRGHTSHSRGPSDTAPAPPHSRRWPVTFPQPSSVRRAPHAVRRRGSWDHPPACRVGGHLSDASLCPTALRQERLPSEGSLCPMVRQPERDLHSSGPAPLPALPPTSCASRCQRRPSDLGSPTPQRLLAL